jgi:hypothetical protein
LFIFSCRSFEVCRFNLCEDSAVLALRTEIKSNRPQGISAMVSLLRQSIAALREADLLVAAQNRDGDAEWRSFADCRQDALQRLDDGVKISPLQRAMTVGANPALRTDSHFRFYRLTGRHFSC